MKKLLFLIISFISIGSSVKPMDKIEDYAIPMLKIIGTSAATSLALGIIYEQCNSHFCPEYSAHYYDVHENHPKEYNEYYNKVKKQPIKYGLIRGVKKYLIPGLVLGTPIALASVFSANHQEPTQIMKTIATFIPTSIVTSLIASSGFYYLASEKNLNNRWNEHLAPIFHDKIRYTASFCIANSMPLIIGALYSCGITCNLLFKRYY